MCRRRQLFLLAAASLILCTCGCHKRLTINLPATKTVDPSEYSLDQYTQDLANYENATRPGALDLTAAKLARNNIAYGLMTQIEVIYGTYYARLFGSKNTLAIAGDVASLGIGSAATIATKAATKTIYAALGAAFTGINLSISKNIYAQESFQVIGVAMQTRRDKVRAVVLSNLSQDVATYPLNAVKRDLIVYAHAGTLAAGLQELQEEAGTNTGKTPQNAVADAPKHLTARSGLSEISLKWDPVAHATSYNVYSGRSTGVTAANGTKLASVTVPASTDMGASTTAPTYYVVTAVNAAGESAISNEASETAKAPGTGFAGILLPPTDVAASAGANLVTLVWNASATARSFNVYRGSDANVNKSTGTKLYSGAQNSFVDTAVNVNTTYYYVVTAVSGGAESAESTPAAGATPSLANLLPGPGLLSTPH